MGTGRAGAAVTLVVLQCGSCGGNATATLRWGAHPSLPPNPHPSHCTVPVRVQVCHLLSQHSGVQYLNARGVAFTANSLVTLLPRLT